MNTGEEMMNELDVVDRKSRALLDDLDDARLAAPYLRGINPPIWELGHAAFFYEYFLLRKLGEKEARMPGYDDVWDSFEIAHKHRWRPGVVPDKGTMLDYYRGVLDEVRAGFGGKSLNDQERYLLRYVIHHHQMHIESLLWARQTLGYPAPSFATLNDDLPKGTGISGDALVEGGEYDLGMPSLSSGEFSFDSERPGHQVTLRSFSIAKTLVTNREFLEFVEDGGYRDQSVWDFGGQCWLLEGNGGQREMPAYWRRDKSGVWRHRKFDVWEDLPLDAPVLHVSVWEAEAFCRWAGRRLPTEAEWEAAARGPEALRFPWGGDVMDTAQVDMDGTFFGTAPADAFGEGASPTGCLQMLGTSWEWTSSQFLPYAGFEVDMYHYMSVLQFGDHRVTKGGSCATCSNLIRNSYRQAYLPGRTDVFTGFRTCAS
ncbi:MAG: SUMF1/EgtB/PvdO family nonheme iron enzyme [Akkermansiaceae bacterium]|jgi:iron(II)-dependent oxidoreductase|tara:strand:- start:2265 stop:3548 length:1284 start_codon:yes stop_codon:yes gene_type:complete